MIIDKGIFKFYLFFSFFILKNIFKKKIIIKSPHPFNKNKQSWGDYHLSIDLQNALCSVSDFSVYVVPFEYWNLKLVNAVASYILVIRGLRICNTNHNPPHFMYLISHAESLTAEEVSKYKHIFCASKKFTNVIKTMGASCEYLPQFTVLNKFKSDKQCINDLSNKVLFIGNTRGVYRESVRYCVESDLDLCVYGKGWEGFIAQKYIKGQFIKNEDLYKYYCSDAIVINDHWSDMKESGFVSNRIYDVTACGGFVISDYIDSIVDDYSGSVETYRSKHELVKKIKYYLKKPEERRKKANLSKVITQQNFTDVITAKKILGRIINDLKR